MVKGWSGTNGVVMGSRLYVFAFCAFVILYSPSGFASIVSEASQARVVRKIIITTQGGSGHLQAAERIKQDLDKEGVGYAVVDVVSENYMQSGMNVGKFGVTRWNHASRKGHIKDMDRLAEYQWLAERWYGDRFYRRIFAELASFPQIDEVIDTQPLNTDQILRAVGAFNEIAHNDKRCAAYNRKVRPAGGAFSVGPEDYIRFRDDAQDVVRYRKVLTDLPTDESRHFLGSIKRVDEAYVRYFTIETAPYPGDSNGKKTRAYFRKRAPQLFSHAGHNPIKVTHGPIRHGFLDFIEAAASKAEPLPIHVASRDEYDGMLAAMGGPAAWPLSDDGSRLDLTLGEAEAHSIMLGSQIPQKQIFAYIEAELAAYRKLGAAARPRYLFVFSGPSHGPESLFQQVVTYAQTQRQAGTLPAGFHLVPLGFQTDKLIGRLYSLADRIVIRSGGLSAMEVEAVSRGSVFIHSAYDKEADDLSAELIKDGMPSWEWGNALHMLECLRGPDGIRRAHIVNPGLFRKLIGA